MKKNTKKDQKFGQIMGINVTSTSINQVLLRVANNISHNYKFNSSSSKSDNSSKISTSESNKFYIVTPNPELVLMAQNNSQLRKSLNSSDFPIPDGVGLNYASKFLYRKSLTIIPGRILFGNLIKLADKNGWRVFFFGGRTNEAQKAAEKINLVHKGVKIKTLKGPILDENAEPATEINRKLYIDAVRKINKFKPHLLFVALGNPKQELWIYKNLAKLNIGGAMAVGGTFRYEAAFSQTPPDWMQSLGLEWLWRLVTEPYRFGRIANAVIIFPIKVFLYKYGAYKRIGE